jgi:transposase InsO family protein
MAQVLGITAESLRRWQARREMPRSEPQKRGRPESISAWVCWLIRQCHEKHYGEWGPVVLSYWAEREDLGSYGKGAIARVIADLRPKKEPRPRPKRYEVSAAMVMWSEDGAGFRERGRKRELLLVQDERSRKKVGRSLVHGPAAGSDVAACLREAFEAHGAPLVLKQDNGSPLNAEEVKDLCDDYCVVLLNSPPGYPPYNGKKERNFRDVRGFERAMTRHGVEAPLAARIEAAIHDLDVERPRPVLGGRTATEAFEQDRIALPDRRRFKMEVETRCLELEAEAGSRTEIAAARRRAVVEVLSRYGLLIWKAGVSTNSPAQTGT